MRRLSLIAVALAAAVLAPAAAAQEPPVPADPCTDPNLLCPDLVMAPPTDLRLKRSPSGRTVLRAENRIVNVGLGPMEVRASVFSFGIVDAAEQIVRRADGDVARFPDAGDVTFKFVDRYRGSYWKYDNAARFELWTVDPQGGRVALVRTGPKLAYCLRDLDRVRRGPGVPRRRVYPACTQAKLPGRVRLGTSVGWADVYPARYPENWIDITGLRGCFAFVHRADPLDDLHELREDNNLASRLIELPPRHGRVGPRGGCPVL